MEFIGDRGEPRIGGGDELRRLGVGDIKKEYLFLALENAQQATAGDGLAVVRKADMVRFVAGSIGCSKGDRGDRFAVVLRCAVEVYDGQEVGRGASLVTSADKEVLPGVVICGGVGAGCREETSGGYDQQSGVMLVLWRLNEWHDISLHCLRGVRIRQGGDNSTSHGRRYSP